MKKLVLASLALAALASCSKESTVDVSISSAQIPMQFSTYSSSTTTKGIPVDTNTEFQDATKGYGSFEVAAYANTSTFGKYFNFSTATWGDSKWNNIDDMYYPNEDATILFGAYSPTGAAGLVENSAPSFLGETDNGTPPTLTQKLTIPYTIYGDFVNANETASNVTAQDDLMYAVKQYSYDAPSTEDSSDDATFDNNDVINLHFKHALTQVAFTATKDSDLDVTVHSITICNVVNGGTFEATGSTDTTYDLTANSKDAVPDANVTVDDMGAWTVGTVQNHYTAALNTTVAGVVTSTDTDNPTTLTDADNALMLIPQELTAWVTTDSSGSGTSGSTASVAGTNSYLAINCTITHTDGSDGATYVPIIDGIIYVPFSTSGITYDYNAPDDSGAEVTDFTTKYKDAWAPGYKITYNLNFGGGYTDPTPGTPEEGEDPETLIPDPGTEPDPDDVVPTLRAITYTVTVDEWKTPTSNGSVTL